MPAKTNNIYLFWSVSGCEISEDVSKILIIEWILCATQTVINRLSKYSSRCSIKHKHNTLYFIKAYHENFVRGMTKILVQFMNFKAKNCEPEETKHCQTPTGADCYLFHEKQWSNKEIWNRLLNVTRQIFHRH